MSYPYEPHMTQDMLDCIISEADLIAEFELSFAKYKEATDAGAIHLPALAATGQPVLHGARKVTLDIADYWLRRARAASDILDCHYNKIFRI